MLVCKVWIKMKKGGKVQIEVGKNAGTLKNKIK